VVRLDERKHEVEVITW